MEMHKVMFRMIKSSISLFSNKQQLTDTTKHLSIALAQILRVSFHLLIIYQGSSFRFK